MWERLIEVFSIHNTQLNFESLHLIFSDSFEYLMQSKSASEAADSILWIRSEHWRSQGCGRFVLDRRK